MTLRLLALTLLGALLFQAAPAAAKQPTEIEAAAFPAPSGDRGNLSLAAIDGFPVALGRDRAQILRHGIWSAIGTRDIPSKTLALVSDSRRSAILSGADGVATAAAALTLANGAIVAKPLPDLPVPLHSAVGAFQPDALLVAGVSEDGAPRLFRLAWAQSARWQALAPWPGGVPVALAAQNRGIAVTLADQQQWRWLPAGGWRRGATTPGTVVGAPRAIGQAYLLYLLRGPGGTHLYSYSMITDAWAPLGAALPGEPLAAVSHGEGLLIASRRNGALAVSTLTLRFNREPLGLIDWAIITAYLFAMLGIGLAFYRRAKGGPSSEFFLGSRAIPAWAAGVSMFAGSISSISYLAVPAKAFETDWQYIMSKIATVCGLMFVALVVVPVFRRLNLVSVFNYLEARFHPAIRMLSSALWICMQIGGRMGIVLFLPAMAIGTITDTNIVACILIVGLFTIVYTALGGMRAVVWTDVFQVLVLTAGAFFAIGFVIYQIGFGNVVDTATAFDKTRMLNFSFDVTQPTVWAFLVLALFDVVLTFPKDQVLMQRVLATPSEKEAKRSVWLFALILLPSAFMFYIIGTVLFAYYRARPEQLSPTLPIDAVFPAFIGTELPPGIVGLIIAGLIAAAMGTLSGIINSVATLLSVDFYERLVPGRSERQIVRFAEWASVGVGLVGIAIAIVLSRLDIHSLLDLTIELFGLLGGACAGAYTLGLFTRRANWQGVAIGIVAASIITFVVWWFGLVHPYLYLALAIASSIVIGYLTSYLFPPPSHSLEGLTIYSRRRARAVSDEAAPSIPVS
ncbi:sodium:solute symporter [Sphingomonas lycopersici]|uniref:Sodium/solute symporter n=1 Tax=Sphingomonas lycopersici TaxID=2951807 RepID=A0AA41ZC68_9SPHN|nr:sodium/solute symporter [Sphingomonas lycopersici]MCW6533951.1 sodium/solute symporter [Sphingomonas lycopersici]